VVTRLLSGDEGREHAARLPGVDPGQRRRLGLPSPGSNPPPSPDAFTTSEVPLALLLQPFPVHATFSAGFTSAQEDHSILASLLYLQTQQQSDGSIPEEFGGYADSELYAIAAAADGYDPTALTASSGVSVMTYLAASVASACPPAPLLPVDLETSSGAGDCGELIQAVVAAGRGSHRLLRVNLISRLGGYLQGSGAYGTARPSPRRSPSKDWWPPVLRCPPPRSRSWSTPRTVTVAGTTWTWRAIRRAATRTRRRWC